MQKAGQGGVGAALAAVISGSVGWAAGALTLQGRVTAIEQAVLRIETRMDSFITGKEQGHGQEKATTAPR